MKGNASHDVTRRRILSKAGCRTCKIRKVKCDEGRPACHRCISTGRVCDGYGIWGGGGNGYGSRIRSAAAVENRQLAPIGQPIRASVHVYSSEEGHYFEWFRCCTVKKIPGAFVLNFWANLLVQASTTEPAVFHALLAISCAHKKLVQDGFDGKEQFLLKQYSTAISHLRPHFSNKERASVQVALIVCVVFTCLEFLRGNFRTAQEHLSNGLYVLRESQDTGVEDWRLTSGPDHSSIDRCIVEAFSRLRLQAELFQQTFHHSSPPFSLPSRSLNILRFDTINEAWEALERLFHYTFQLSEQAHQQGALTENPGLFSILLKRQNTLQTALTAWHATYMSSLYHLCILQRDGFLHHLLSGYYDMATIMCATSIRHDESAYDMHTHLFFSIITHSRALWKISLTLPLERPWSIGEEQDLGLSTSVIDLGWIPPLYHVAMKCRVRCIRLYALKLLRETTHREGIWDARISSSVGAAMMQIEEEDDVCVEALLKDTKLDTELDINDVIEPSIPLEQRLHEVEVVLEDGSTDSVVVKYKRPRNSELEMCRVSLVELK